MKNVQESAERVVANVERVIVGKHLEVRMALVALLCEGHILIEDVPGVGKTMLAKAVSRSIGCSFRRIQFTPDLLPSDVTGLSIFNQKTQEFEFRPGPIMAQVVLADEINRATPKTQSALLEAMGERQVTVGDRTRPLAEPFFVLATQNPIELEGTYPLPEAQLDRFFFKLIVPFPDAEDLAEIARRTTGSESIELAVVAGGAELAGMRALSREVPMASHVLDRAVALVLATHPDKPGSPEEVHRYVRWGSSPRGLQSLVLAARIRALLDGRFNVALDDLAAVAPAALRHRVFLNFEADAAGVGSDSVVQAVIAAVSTASPGADAR